MESLEVQMWFVPLFKMVQASEDMATNQDNVLKGF